jgi:serine/threonine protein kinase
MNPERWQQIKRLYNSALELEPARREAFLQEVCAGDDSLRQEIERLLAQQAEAEDLLGKPALEVAARALVQDRKDEPQPNYVGRLLLHYRITEKIGEGGMGVVYSAEDRKLGRQVAIKFLAESFARDEERLARFAREARLLAALVHPNIAAIHGLEEWEGKPFLVLELAEGKTLAERLKKGRIPLDETLDICRQIAEGLEAAHEKGIIHRDLKPANVKVTPEGKVKILDFGLAKAFYEQAVPADASKSPTITEQMTAPGVILGTAAYMSPEQARGKPVDKRADIWAFGCVLYECLTGKRTFQGDTVTETVAAILKSEPDWTLLPAETPSFVRAVLRHCLQKEPSRRLHDIADARVDMLEDLTEPAVIIPAAQRFSLGRVLLISTATLVIGLLAGLMLMKYRMPSVSLISQPVVRTPIKLEPGHWVDGWRANAPWGLDQPTRTAMAISGDGRFIVYAAVKENPGEADTPRLYLRRFDQLEAKPIAGTEGGISPFLSPDNRWVGFWAGGKLMKVSIEGGVPQALCDVPSPFGFSWGEDNQIVFSAARGSGLTRISAAGGKPETLTTPDRSKGEFAHRLPYCLPAGKGILFTIKHHPWDHTPCVAVMGVGTQRLHVLLEDAADARYVVTGHLAFLRRGTLMAVPFDPDRLEVTGQPVPAVANISQALNTTNSSMDTAAGQFCISTSGSLVYASGGIVPDQQNSLVWMDHKGKSEQVASFKAPFWAPRLSPDGQRIAYSSLGMEGHIRVYDLNRGTATKLTSEGMSEWALWTPDGRRVAFDLVNTGVPNIYWQPADGSSPMERLTESECFQWPGSWTPDGETLAFVEVHADMETGSDIQLLHVRDRRVTPFLNTRFSEEFPEFSPDGRWLAYSSDESGRKEVYVQAFTGPGGKWQVSNEGGSAPLWARNGKQVFYRSPVQSSQDQVWVVDVQKDEGFRTSKPRLLCKTTGFQVSGQVRSWDISLDGQKFLIVKLDDRKLQPTTEMILVQNWFEELKRLCPAK